MVQAFTTAAIINFSMGAPSKPVRPLEFMPHFRKPTRAVETETTQGRSHTKDEIQDWNLRIANLAAELKQGHGPMLDAIKKEANAGK
jgi:hypothetical protein